MSERTLTLPEIDALLAMFRGRAGADESQVSTYELDTPSRAPRAALDGVVVRHEQAARAMRDELTALFNTDVDVVLEAFEQIRFGSLRETLPDPSCMFLVEMAPLREPALVALDVGFAFSGIDRLLGGKTEVPVDPRELTPTEFAVAEEIVRPIIAAHVMAWSAYAPIRAGAMQAAPKARFIRELKSEDVLFSARYRLKGFAEGAAIRFATPVSGLEPHLQKEPRPMVAAKDATSERDLAAHMAAVRMEVGVRLGGARLTLRELVGLERDDVIVLDRAVDDGCELCVAGVPKFTGFVGQSRGRLTYRVRTTQGRPQGPASFAPAKKPEKK